MKHQGATACSPVEAVPLHQAAASRCHKRPPSLQLFIRLITDAPTPTTQRGTQVQSICMNDMHSFLYIAGLLPVSTTIAMQTAEQAYMTPLHAVAPRSAGEMAMQLGIGNVALLNKCNFSNSTKSVLHAIPVMTACQVVQPIEDGYLSEPRRISISILAVPPS